MPEGQNSTVRSRHPDPPDSGLVRILADDGSIEAGADDPGLSPETKLRLYRALVRTRALDRALEKLQRQGRIAFHVSSLGEEAAIVASAAALAEEDWIVPCYREIGAHLYRAPELGPYLDMMFGNVDDEASGHQMPEHSSFREQRYASVSAPIGTQITHAAGMAYAARCKRSHEVVAVYFGDGATSSNDFHAGMNFAGVKKLPVLFLCRNNRWAISLPNEEQTAAAHLVDKAVGYGMKGVRCDGNDPLAVYAVVREARKRALEGRGPTFVEMMTYRESGHSTSDDPTVYRSEAEVSAFVAIDPIPRWKRHLEHLGIWDEARESAQREAIDAEIKQAIAVAEAKAKPPLESIFDDVYETRTRELERQLDEARRGARGGER